MIATRAQLAIALGLAVVLAAVVALDLRRVASPPPDHAVAPGLDPAQVTALRWDRGGAGVDLVRDGAGWRLTRPTTVPADRRAVEVVLSTLRAARWHRRGPVAAAGPTTVTLTIEGTGATPQVIALGAELAGTEQAWIVVGDRALLVDRWVVRALDAAPLDLVVRRPFDAVTAAPAIELSDEAGAVRLDGTPRVLRAPATLLVDPPHAAALERALGALELEQLAPAGADAGPALAIEVGAVRATLGGACPGGRVRLAAAATTGCVTAAAAEAVTAAVAALRRPPAELADRRPAPVEPVTIVLPDGAVLDLSRQPRVGEHAADPVRVAELLAVLHAPAEVVAVPAPAGTPRSLTNNLRTPSGSAARPSSDGLAITTADGTTLVVELLAPGLVRRAGEPVALRLTAAAWEVLARPARALRDRTLWIEDPLAIAAISIDGTSFARGAVIGEWTRRAAPAGTPELVDPTRAAALDELARLLASPVSEGDAPPGFAPRRRVTITVTQTGGAPVEHVLELGRGAPGAGCPARTGGVSVRLPATLCDAVAEVARQVRR